MKKEELSALEESFNQLIETLLDKKEESEQFTAKLSSERSQFTRFNHAKVRQTGYVADGWIQLTLMQNQRSSFREFPFTGNWEVDWQLAYEALQELREELPQLSVDPYLVLPSGTNTSREVHSGNLLAAGSVVPTVLAAVAELDFTGLYAGGVVIKAYGDSSSQKHWFATDTFVLDYSLFTTEGQAVKGILAGSDWNNETYASQINDAKIQLELLSRPVKKLPRGQYRTYFAPAAVDYLLNMLSWGGVGEADLQQGGSALASLWREEKQLSPAFNLKENFLRGLVPRFNEWGEMAALWSYP